MTVKRRLLFWGTVWPILLGLLVEVAWADTIMDDITSVLAKLASNAEPIIKLVIAVAFLIGLGFIISALMQLKDIGKSSGMMQSSALKGPLVKFIIGITLLYLPSTINVGVATFWGSSEIMEYSTDSSGAISEAKRGIIALMQIIGYISFVRGLLMLSQSTQSNAQPGLVGKGILHVVGGILSINIVGSLAIVQATFGLNFL